MKDIKIALEVAESEFNRWCDEMDVDNDISKFDDDDKAMFEKQKKRIVDAIMYGHLTIDDEGQAVYKPWRKASGEVGPITFKERTGASLVAMDRIKKGQDAKKTYAMMGEMCGIPSAIFYKLAGSDIKVCEAIFALLMD